MSGRLPKLRTFASVGLAAIALSLPLVAGCAGGPSQEELSLLDQKRLATEAAENKVVQLKADKARLERLVADKRAEKKALQEKLAIVRNAVADWPSN
jgi:outer membrane murein-binding lipoprotein Lpp